MAGARAINIEERDQLLAYLRDRGAIGGAEAPATQSLPGGVSNRAILVTHSGREDWVIKQALPKLRVPVDWTSDPSRIQREAAGLRWLARIIPGQVPEIVFDDPERNILAMTAIPQPHYNWKTALLDGRVEPRFARAFGRLLATIHRAVEQHPELESEFAERRFFEELRLEPYYGYAARATPAAAPFLTHLIQETRARQFTLVHGDYSPKNVLIQADRLIILDFEVAHFGDPAFDVGFALTHFLSKARHLPARRDAFLELARCFWHSYHAGLSADFRALMPHFATRHTLACMLARVDGRSPLEYLDGRERDSQRRTVLALMAENIELVPELLERYQAELRRA